MQYIKSKSGLIVPNTTEIIIDRNDFNPKLLENLNFKSGYDNLAQATKEIYKILKKSNQSVMTYTDRFKLLATLKEGIFTYTYIIRNKYTENDVLDSESSNIVELVDSLKFEMLIGYKLVIDNGLKHFFYKKSTILSALHHAMYYCSRIIYSSFKHHTNVPAGIWYDFHSLHSAAVRIGLDSKKYAVSIGKTRTLSKIHDIYKHYLLLALIDPPRFKQNTIKQFLYLTEEWASLLILTDNLNKGVPMFYIDVDNDFPPKLIAKNKALPAHGYYLDLSKIVAKISMLMERQIMPVKRQMNLSNNHVEISMPTYLLEMLLKIWITPYKRSQERIKETRQIRACIGLASIYEHLVQAECQSKVNYKEVIDETLGVEEINLDLFSLPDDNVELCQHEKATHPIYLGETVDISEGGCYIKWTNEKPKNMINGEIIAIEMEEQGQQVISIGVVRRLKNEGNDLYTGIEFISKNPFPALAKISKNATIQHTPSLLVENQINNMKNYRLITNGMTFRIGNDVNLKLGENVLEGSLVEQNEISLLYKDFALDLDIGSIDVPLRIQTAFCFNHQNARSM